MCNKNDCFSCLLPILLNTIAAVQNVDPLLIKSARTLGLSDAKLFRKVILPAAVPTIFVGADCRCNIFIRL